MPPAPKPPTVVGVKPTPENTKIVVGKNEFENLPKILLGDLISKNYNFLAAVIENKVQPTPEQMQASEIISKLR